MRNYLFSLLLVLVALLMACGNSGSQNVSSQPAPNAAPSTATPKNSLPKIVAFGDSLTAGLGLTESESYPSLLQRKLDADGYKYEVVNSGVSGDTSAGGLRRIDWALEGEVHFLILELGANDMLRGQPVPLMKKNLGQIIERAKSRRVEVLLAGMYAPTNSGAQYQQEIRDAFQALAQEHQVTLIPFLLDRVGGIESLNQADGIHPNAEGTRIVTETVYQALRPLLEKQKQAASK
ncbi:MAG: arylesterase [Pyrinomonadaceae bacterium]|nr:arylesterase [Pyrinomonadaceae bacterium]